MPTQARQHCAFEHSASSLQDVSQALTKLGCDMAVLKLLPKNANDKNQVYVSADYGSLHRTFSLALADRGAGTSTKKPDTSGRRILEAVFCDFSWVDAAMSMVRARGVRVIIYPQYPEARLSSFQTIDARMPRALSVEFTKAEPDRTRLLVLGRQPGGACVAMLYVDVPDAVCAELASLPGLEGSRVCKVLDLGFSGSTKLFAQLAPLMNVPLRGCRLDQSGRTLPFTGTQVCGYTLEHALGIVPNSDMDGDIYGIELKTHTQPKVTLFTPEPDFGLYAQSFDAFMKTHGYLTAEGDYRVTGVHRAGVRNKKSGLTLRVREYRLGAEGLDGSLNWLRNTDGSRAAFPYDPNTALAGKMDAVEVVLEADSGSVAAGWSLERLMNNWGVKHNQAVFITADKSANQDPDELAAGYAYKVKYSSRVLWCQHSSAERLLKAIHEGVIFLDPAPKLVPGDPASNKRRAQWRVNDIRKAVHNLYEQVEIRDLMATPAASAIAIPAMAA
jgi:hypothetical protein